jgi:hypothetical protein
MTMFEIGLGAVERRLEEADKAERLRSKFSQLRFQGVPLEAITL